MKFTHEFAVDAPIDTAWSELTDLESVAALLPGAQLTGRDGDAYLGTVKVKVGPVTSAFAGRAVFREKDDAAHRAVIEASGKDARGAGNASATITVTLAERDGGTAAEIDTDMRIVGKLAQVGSGVIGQVSVKLMGQFAQALEAKLAAAQRGTPPAERHVTPPAEQMAPPAARGTAQAAPLWIVPEVPAGAAPEQEELPAPEPEPIDLMEVAGPALLRRLLPVIAAVAAGFAVAILIRRSGARSGADGECRRCRR